MVRRPRPVQSSYARSHPQLSRFEDFRVEAIVLCPLANENASVAIRSARSVTKSIQVADRIKRRNRRANHSGKAHQLNDVAHRMRSDLKSEKQVSPVQRRRARDRDKHEYAEKEQRCIERVLIETIMLRKKAMALPQQDEQRGKRAYLGDAPESIPAREFGVRPQLNVKPHRDFKLPQDAEDGDDQTHRKPGFR
jgi:hypothetical protein